MQRAFTSTRARATGLTSGAAAKFRSGAGLGQQLRFAHKVSRHARSVRRRLMLTRR